MYVRGGGFDFEWFYIFGRGAHCRVSLLSPMNETLVGSELLTVFQIVGNFCAKRVGKKDGQKNSGNIS